MNVAARIESTGEPGRIHVSQDTADRLVTAGKGHWLEKRKEPIHAKGKGDLQTYFVGSGFDRHERGSATGSVGNVPTNNLRASSSEEPEKKHISGLDQRSLRLVEWNVEMLLAILKQIIARREATLAAASGRRMTMGSKKSRTNSSLDGTEVTTLTPFDDDHPPLEEVKEIIHLPGFNRKVASKQRDPEDVEVPPKVISQLREYVIAIAGMYRQNDFHNFEHASHVTMSVIKLLSRIVAPTDLNLDDENKEEDNAATLHDHTYGIVSVFSVIFFGDGFDCC